MLLLGAGGDPLMTWGAMRLAALAMGAVLVALPVLGEVRGAVLEWAAAVEEAPEALSPGHGGGSQSA